jgi:hypothetical protein
MKINEILNPVTKRVNPSKGLYDRTSALNNPKRLIGKGKYGITVKSNNPHEVVKLSSHNENRVEDHYNFFVDAVLFYNEKHGQSNPFFPRFFKVVTAKQKGERHDMVQKKIVKMERLLPFRSCTAQEIFTMGTHYFGDDFKVRILDSDSFKELMVSGASWEKTAEERFNAKYGKGRTVKEYDLMRMIKEDNPKLKNMMIAIITRLIDSNVNDPNEEVIVDPRLLDAVEWVHHCMTNPQDIGYQYASPGNDIHEGNLMIRRGGAYPQLVITDPYY